MSEENQKRAWRQQPMNIFGGGGNYILEPDNEHTFAISFQPNQQLGSFFGASVFDAETPNGETAICDYRDPDQTRYYILNGDFRDKYEDLLPQGIEACLAFYESQKAEFGSSWTTPED